MGEKFLIFDVALLAVTSPFAFRSYLTVCSSIKSRNVLCSIQTVCAQRGNIFNNQCR